jgi:tRNA G46 methylase TrmB
MRLYWKKQKLLSMLNNRKQHQREFDTNESIEVEIVTGEGHALLTESSSQTQPTYIIVET